MSYFTKVTMAFMRCLSYLKMAILSELMETTKQPRADFEWVDTKEPHLTRRREMLKKYPQIKELMGPYPWLAVECVSLVIVQVVLAYLVQDASWTTILLLAYGVGGVINHSMTLAIHDISHNVPFGNAKPFWNRVIGIVANLPLGIPMSVSFKKYHVDHHRYLGDERYDVDLPTPLEGELFKTRLGKLCWLLLNPFLYAFRPLYVNPKPVMKMEYANFLAQLIFDSAIVYFFNWRAMVYLLIGTPMTMGLHPIAGHFIAEHYMYVKGYETYSYYGVLNYITFNVGYHNEHHDFPNIPGARLPQLRKIAPEYYENIPCHTSWIQVLWDFITDPTKGPYARIRRKSSVYNHDD